jgi:hypothetical protein
LADKEQEMAERKSRERAAWEREDELKATNLSIEGISRSRRDTIEEIL